MLTDVWLSHLDSFVEFFDAEVVRVEVRFVVVSLRPI